jgi:hypothetical protein
VIGELAASPNPAQTTHSLRIIALFPSGGKGLGVVIVVSEAILEQLVNVGAKKSSTVEVD